MKRFLAAALAFLTVFGLLPIQAVAGGSTFAGKTVVASGNSVYLLESDPDTSSGYQTKGFGTTAADGYVWTDKSVNTVGESLSVKLSAMGQEFVMTEDEMSELYRQTSADVLFILDFSGSMGYKIGSSDTTRMNALIQSVNTAMNYIMTANTDNRVMLCSFAGSSYTTILDLASWGVKNSSGKISVPEKYFDDSDVTSKTFKTISGKNLFKFGSTSGSGTSIEKTANGGTPTQYGIAGAVENFLSKASVTKASAGGKRRVPYVILVTDGVPSQADTTWYESKACRHPRFNSV